MVVLEHFLKKASLRYLVDCGCRIGKKCTDYDARLGCMYLGKGVAKLDLTLPWRIEKHAHLATFEEAMEQAKKAIDSGLVPIMGRYRAEAAMMYALPDEGDMLTICYCCPCCCVQGGVKNSSSALRKVIKRMEGVTVEIDQDLCVGCEDCLDVCIYDGIKMIDEKAHVDQESCLGCGRCERACQNDAISINIDDYKHVDELIARIESYVNVA
jgi:UDP-glucose 4-epimerase